MLEGWFTRCGQVDRFTAGESEDRPRVNLLLSHYLSVLISSLSEIVCPFISFLSEIDSFTPSISISFLVYRSILLLWLERLKEL